jgi:Tol biopolymer transport system component
LVLWDNVDQRDLWRKEYYGGPPNEGALGLPPSAWTTDSNLIAFAYGDRSNAIQIYMLDRDGTSTVTVPSLFPPSYIEGLSWSPNQQYLAFVAESSMNVDQFSIVVYDRETQRSTVVCKLRNGDKPIQYRPSRLIWSPDNQYLIFDLGGYPSEGNNLLAMDNIHSGEVRWIKNGDQGYFLVGWSPIAPWLAPK